jgi:hypothetical protein
VQRSLIPVAAKYLVHIHEEVSMRRRDSSVSAWLNIIYGRLERCAHCVISPGRGLELNISMDAIRAELDSIAERAIATSFLFAKILIFRVPYPMGNGYENPGQNGNFIEHKSNRVPTVLDTLIRLEPSPSAGKDPPFRKLRKLSGIFVHCHEILRAWCDSP